MKGRTSTYSSKIWNTKIAGLAPPEKIKIMQKTEVCIEYVCVRHQAVFIKSQDPALTASNRSVTVEHNT